MSKTESSTSRWCQQGCGAKRQANSDKDQDTINQLYSQCTEFEEQRTLTSSMILQQPVKQHKAFVLALNVSIIDDQAEGPELVEKVWCICDCP